MDATGADFFRCVNTVRDRLKANAVPIQITNRAKKIVTREC